MELGYGHTYSYIGEEGMLATKEQAIKINPNIEVISWPIARWR